jgi:hypothetical protein
MRYLKKILLVIVLLSFPCFAWASPFLVCDPYPADQLVIGFRGTVNGTNFDIPYALTSDKTGAIIYDCAALGDGAWNFTNIRAYNTRGESTGIPFAYPALPGAPSRTRVSK